MANKKHRNSFLHDHSLGLVSVLLLALWIVLYSVSDPNSHLGAFFGNAIADWSGSVVIIYGTKYLIEAQYSRTQKIHRYLRNRIFGFVHRHSLLIFLGVTGLGWAVLFWKLQVNGKWGQVVGNIVSGWVQMSGLVFLTRRLVEKGSEESK